MTGCEVETALVIIRKVMYAVSKGQQLRTEIEAVVEMCYNVKTLTAVR